MEFKRESNWIIGNHPTCGRVVTLASKSETGKQLLSKNGKTATVVAILPGKAMVLMWPNGNGEIIVRIDGADDDLRVIL